MPEADDTRVNRLPDFIIGGAMKAGTSSLHTLLKQHPNVHIPATREPRFFCMDDIRLHPSFFGVGSTWTVRDYQSNLEAHTRWYERFFENAASHQLIGDDSPSYLASAKAPRRIAEMLPEAKIIFLLRDPVARTYSHYWHSLAAGGATYTFGNQLRYAPGTLLERGFYRDQIERYLQCFPRSQLKFIIFEEYTSNTQACVEEVWKFLGLSGGPDITDMQTRRNQSWYPRWPKVLAWQNRLLRVLRSKPTQNHFTHGNEDQESVSFVDQFLQRTDHRLRYVNLHPAKRPPMDPEIKSFLERLFAKENRGLSELIGVDLSEHWPYMKRC